MRVLDGELETELHLAVKGPNGFTTFTQRFSKSARLQSID